MRVPYDGLLWEVPEGSADFHLGPSDHEGFLRAIFVEEWARLDGRAFLDVGAHIGRYTVRAASRGHRVIAVEPNAATVLGLAENCRLNALRNVAILPVAAWSKLAMLTLRPSVLTPSSPATWQTVEPEGETKAAFCVPGYPLEQLITEPVGFVKIDTEGAEAAVLRGLQAILRSDRPRLLIEVHDGYYGDDVRRRTIGELEAAGYLHEPVGELGGATYLRAWPRAGSEGFFA